MARALGSYPSCPRFESRCRYHFTKDRTTRPFHIERPGGQAVKTPPFHGGTTGSSPVRVTTSSLPFLLYGGIAQPVERPPHTRKVTDSSSVVSTRKKTTTHVVVFFILPSKQTARPRAEGAWPGLCSPSGSLVRRFKIRFIPGGPPAPRRPGRPPAGPAGRRPGLVVFCPHRSVRS